MRRKRLRDFFLISNCRLTICLVLMEVGETKLRLKPGDSVLAPRNVAHVWAYLGQQPGLQNQRTGDKRAVPPSSRPAQSLPSSAFCLALRWKQETSLLAPRMDFPRRFPGTQLVFAPADSEPA